MWLLTLRKCAKILCNDLKISNKWVFPGTPVILNEIQNDVENLLLTGFDDVLTGLSVHTWPPLGLVERDFR